MPDVDFVMPYPCYFLLDKLSNPEFVIVGELRCLCLFTDKDLVERFYKEKYGANFATREISAATMPTAAILIETMKKWQEQLALEGCMHVAIDPGGGKQVMYVTIVELLDHLETNP